VDDRARIGEQEAVVVDRRHLAERRSGTKAGIRIADADALELEIEALFAQKPQQFSYERRYDRPIDYHHDILLIPARA